VQTSGPKSYYDGPGGCNRAHPQHVLNPPIDRAVGAAVTLYTHSHTQKQKGVQKPQGSYSEGPGCCNRAHPQHDPPVDKGASAAAAPAAASAAAAIPQAVPHPPFHYVCAQQLAWRPNGALAQSCDHTLKTAQIMIAAYSLSTHLQRC